MVGKKSFLPVPRVVGQDCPGFVTHIPSTHSAQSGVSIFARKTSLEDLGAAT